MTDRSEAWAAARPPASRTSRRRPTRRSSDRQRSSAPAPRSAASPDCCERWCWPTSLGRFGAGRRLQPRQHHTQHRLRPDPRRDPVGHARAGLRRPLPARRRRRRERGGHGGDQRARSRSTVTAILAAPWIFRAYTWAAGGNAAELERAGVPLLRLFAAADPLLRAHRPRHRHPQRPAPLRRARVRPRPQQPARLRGAAARSPRSPGATPTVAEIIDHPSWLWLLGAGTTAGIVLMTVALWPSLARVGLALPLAVPPARRRRAQGRRAVGLDARLCRREPDRAADRPRAGGAEGEGVPTVYLYAFQFFQLPYGLFAVSLMTTITPELASAASNGDMVRVPRATVVRHPLDDARRACRPSVGMIVLARPLVAGASRSAVRELPSPRQPTSWPTSQSASSVSRCTCSCSAVSTRSRTRGRRSS